jgi:uncharacterized membrane protein HdeD (DUF308 family)
MFDSVQSGASGYVVLAGLISSNGTGLLLMMVASWVVFWGALAGLVFGSWQKPSPWWLCTGIIGPIAPLVAVVAATAVAQRERSRSV